MPKSNQMHGKSFENLIKGANNGIFGHMAADRERGPKDRFDIGGDLDIKHGWPTSIKVTKTSSIALADARKFWESLDFAPYRILVGRYRQEGGNKIFHEIDEFIMRPDHRAALLGSVTLDEVTKLHEGMKAFGKGEHHDARVWAQEQKKKLIPRLGVIILNPKIHSDRQRRLETQRRLQCSVNLEKLEAITGVSRHTDGFGVLGLPFHLRSRGRAS